MLYFYADLFMAIFTAYFSAAAPSPNTHFQCQTQFPRQSPAQKKIREILFSIDFPQARSDYLFCIFHAVTQMTPKQHVASGVGGLWDLDLFRWHLETQIPDRHAPLRTNTFVQIFID